MTSREIIRQNIEYRCEGRIGFNFGGQGRRDDLAMAGCAHKVPTRTWEEGRIEYSTDIWGNVWHRFIDMSQNGEIFKPVLDDWAALDDLAFPGLDKPEYYAAARELAARDSERFRLGFMPGWPFAVCRYMRKMENYLVDLIAERERIDILHDRVATVLEKVIDGFGTAGLDGIFFCEDLGVQDRPLSRWQMRAYRCLDQ